MANRFQKGAPDALPCFLKRRSRTLGIVALIVTAAAHGAESDSAFRGNVEFDEAFNSYYGALVNHSLDDLTFELSETIEDAMIRGSHMTQTSLDYKTRQIERHLRGSLRGGLCDGEEREGQSLTALKHMSAQSITDAGENAGVTFGYEALGMISSVVVRMIENGYGVRLCRE